MEKLIQCERCGGNACLETIQESTTVQLCFGCGFTTSIHFYIGNSLFDNMISNLPDLHKDLFFQGKDSIWVPSVITLPDRGMVFVDGTGKEDWVWAGVLTTPIKEEEAGKFPEGQINKIDHTTMKHFNHEDYMDALEYIGFFDSNE